MKKVFIIILISFILCFPVYSQENEITELSMEENALNSKSVVFIISSIDNKTDSYGSGVILENGIIVTCEHVVDKFDFLWIVTHNGEPQYWTCINVFYKNKKNDIAIIKLDTDGIPATLGNKNDLIPGSSILAIGSPCGYENTLSPGIFSGITNLNGTEYIQITAPLDHGSSGSGVFDKYGKLIGIIARMNETNNNFGFVIPIDKIMDIVNEFVKS
jgi:S1-C subfamily serine protease